MAPSLQPLGVGEPQAGGHSDRRHAVGSGRRQARHLHGVCAVCGRKDGSVADPPLVDSDNQVRAGAHQGLSGQISYMRGFYNGRQNDFIRHHAARAARDIDIVASRAFHRWSIFFSMDTHVRNFCDIFSIISVFCPGYGRKVVF